MTVRCAANKRDGSPCTATVEPPQTYCWWHDPANADKRRRAASKAGRSKPTRELSEIKGRLSELADDVLAAKVDRADAAAVGQLLNTVIRAVSVELKAKEQLELIERMERLEEVLEQRKGGGYGYGA